MTDIEIDVYATEFERTGFQGGLQWYRCNLPRSSNSELDLLASAGHWVQQERPNETLDLLLPFLQSGSSVRS